MSLKCNPKKAKCFLHVYSTSTGVVSRLLETLFAGAEGIRAIGYALGLVYIAALSAVTAAVVQPFV